MTRKTRAILFFILLILFLLAVPSTLLYSWGYRFDFSPPGGGIKLTQTGGFYFKVWPKSSQIVIDGKPSKRTDFFFGAAYLDNILPKKYEVEIQKEGYHSWKKTLEVKEAQVTDSKNVVLLQLAPKFAALSQNVEEFFVSPDQKKMILKEAQGRSFSLKLLELQGNVKSELAKESELRDTSLAEFVDSFFEVKETESSEAVAKEPEEEMPKGELSPDKKKLAYLSNSEVWVLFLKEELGQPQKRAGERLLVARFSEKISQVFWLTNHYLIFTTGDKIKVAEIDDRDGINIVDFAEFPSPKQIFFNQTDKKLYILSQGNFYSSEKLLP